MTDIASGFPDSSPRPPLFLDDDDDDDDCDCDCDEVGGLDCRPADDDEQEDDDDDGGGGEDSTSAGDLVT